MLEIHKESPKALFTQPIVDLRSLAMEHVESQDRQCVLGEELDKLVKKGSGRAFIALAFTSDFLRLLSMCLLADRKLTPAEVQFLFPLVGPASRLFARYRPEYEAFQGTNRGNVHIFLDFYTNDASLFGFRCPLTRWAGITIVNNITNRCDDPTLRPMAKKCYGHFADALREVSGGGIEIDRIIENVEDFFQVEPAASDPETDFELNLDFEM